VRGVDFEMVKNSSSHESKLSFDTVHVYVCIYYVSQN